MSGGAATETIVRPVVETDLAAVVAIYAGEVRAGTASWELEAPDADAMLARWRAVAAGGYPYLVAVRDGRVAGFAYASAYRPRPGYRYTVEDSVYVAQDTRRSGVGHALLGALVDACAQRGFRQMVAVIGGADPASARLHAAHGFVEVGRLPGLGRKFGRWLDSLLMQRALGDGATTPPASEAQEIR